MNHSPLTRRFSTDTAFLAAVILGATLLLGGVYLRPAALRAVVELPLALSLPGVAFLLALDWPRHRKCDISAVALAVVASLAFYPLGLLILDRLSIRFTPLSVVAVTDIFVLVMIAVTLFRSHRPSVAVILPFRERAAGGRGWMVWAAGTIAASIGVIAVMPSVSPHSTAAPFTQLSLTGSWATRQGPVAVAGGHGVDVPLSVRNDGSTPRVYHLVSSLDGIRFAPPLQLPLKAGASWAGQLSGKTPATGCLHHLVVQLDDSTGATVAMVDTWLAPKAGCAP